MFYIDNYENKISDYIKNYDIKYSNLPNIIGVGLGRKTYDGYRTPTPCLTFLVNKKLSPYDIPNKYILPKTIGSIITDVIETGDFSSNPITSSSINNNNLSNIYPNKVLDRARPAYGGLSCSNEHSILEAEGCICHAVTDIKTSSNIYLLSCNHVLTSDYIGLPGETVFQPSTSCRNKELIGKTSYAVSLIKKSESMPSDSSNEFNEVDAAIAWVGKNEKETRKTILDVGIGPKKITIDGIVEPKLSSKVWKMTPYPQFTQAYGSIRTIQTSIFSFKIGTNKNSPSFMFKNHNIVDINYSPGDAGSMIMLEEKGLLGIGTKNYAVGMCIGGSVTRTNEPYAIFTPINTVLEKLKVKLLK